MKPKKKQYIIEYAYTGHSHVITFVDGKIESETIINDYEISGYTTRLKAEGYTQAYYVPIYQKMHDKALDELKLAEKLLTIAKSFPIKINDNTKKHLEKTLGINDSDYYYYP